MSSFLKQSSSNKHSIKTIKEKIASIEQLGFECTYTKEAFKDKKTANEIREAYDIDCRLIRCAINDISIIIG